MKVSVWHVTKIQLRMIAMLIEVAQVTVHIRFGAMELRIETALGIAERGHVEHQGLPCMTSAPQQALEPDIDLCTGVHEKPHHRLAEIEDAVDAMEQRRLATDAIGVDSGSRVHVGTCLDQHFGTAHKVVLGTDVKRADS